MSSKHLFHVAAACALPLSFAACGSSSNDEPTIIPEGPHYGYVVSGVTLPKNSNEAVPMGLDLGSMTSSKPDGSNDNKLGKLLGTLAGPGVGIPLQPTVDTAVKHGDIILLIDVQTEDLQNSKAAGFGVKIGTMPTPAACTDANDLTTCGRHLDGHGSFVISPSSPADAVVAGKITSGAFDGGPGNISLQVALGSTTPITLDLVHARVRATIKSDGTLTATVGGLVTQDQLRTQIGPVLQAQVMSLITTECTGVPPDCGCPDGSTAALLLGFLMPDANHDCVIMTDELLNSSLKSLLVPDSCSQDSCTTPDALSIGLPVQAVKATFPGAM
jgi:hypothetical protein